MKIAIAEKCMKSGGQEMQECSLTKVQNLILKTPLDIT